MADHSNPSCQCSYCKERRSLEAQTPEQMVARSRALRHAFNKAVLDCKEDSIIVLLDAAAAMIVQNCMVRHNADSAAMKDFLSHLGTRAGEHYIALAPVFKLIKLLDPDITVETLLSDKCPYDAVKEPTNEGSEKVN